ncbi:hypothetical protein, partial [Yersinia enterocolitica]|uniref:hypothetical protein n=1 Tax=Yersinia enterocolitica TaxID=630 RepID=UPI000AFB89C9
PIKKPDIWLQYLSAIFKKKHLVYWERPYTADLGVTRSGQAIRALAQGFQGGYALVTPLAVETMEVK